MTQKLFRRHSTGVLCEIVNKADGSMSRTPELMRHAKEHNLKIITIADLIRYRLKNESLLLGTSSSEMTTRWVGGWLQCQCNSGVERSVCNVMLCRF